MGATTLSRIALCPDDGHEMSLQHRGLELDQWHCEACGEYRTILRRGVAHVEEAPTDALGAGDVQWVMREKGPLHGRIDDEEGG